MTNITKAAKQALAELADWHWSRAATLRKAACTSAMDKPEPGQSSLTRMADWHDTQKSIIRAALQDKAGEVKCQTCNGHGLVGGYMQDGSGYGEGCPDCNPEPAPLVKWGLASQPAPVVPAGFVLVPVEPTEAMIQAGIDEMPHFTDEPGPVWSAMLAASQQKG